MTVQLLRRCAIPEARCLWAIIPAPATRLAPTRLAFLAERVLPVSIDDCQWDAIPLADGRMVIAAIPHATLEQMRNSGEITSATISAGPDTIPTELAAVGVPSAVAGAVEFLRGRHEAPHRQRQRRWMMLAAAASVVVAVGALVWGAQQRIAALHDARDQVGMKTERLAQAALPAPEGAQARQAASVRLLQEWRRLSAAAQSRTVDRDADVVALTQAVWTRWPDSARAQLDQISFTPNRVDVRGTALDAETAAVVTTAFTQFMVDEQQWQASPGSVQMGERSVRFAFSLTPMTAAALGAKTSAELR